MTFRLMLTLAMLAGMAVALVATTQSAHASAHAFGAYFDYEVIGSRAGIFVVNRPTAAQARADALAACTALTTEQENRGSVITRACAEAIPGGFSRCINIASGLTRSSGGISNHFFGLGDTPAAAKAAREAKVLEEVLWNNEQAACNCGGAMSIIDANAPSGCRAATQADCTGGTPILDSGSCRARQQSDCTGDTPILDSGSCRARQASDCTGNTPILDSGSCRAATQGDCTGGTPILAGNNCRARQASDCTGNTPVLESGNCRARQQSDCTGNTPILAGNNCRARQASDCTGNTPILDSGNCRARQAGDCPNNMPILDSGSCRAATQADCTGGTPILDSGSCRARQQSDCTGGTPILDSGSCRARQASDCTGNTPILDSGNCRAVTQADCTGGTPIFENGNCRVRQQSDCTGNTPILDGGNCRARQAGDCTGNTPIFDSGNCRAAIQADCTGATPVLQNGACIARPTTPTPTPPTTGSATATGGGKAKGSFPEAIGGFAAVAGIAWYFSIHDGTPLFGAVQWSPHYSFAMSGGLRRYEVGSRWEWKRDNFVAHWTATKTASDSFAYGSGAKWTGDIFTAAFNSQETGKDTELDFSLLAKKEFGVWSFSPQYRVNFDRDETDETWRHSLALRAVWTADKWTLSNSAGFHGESLAAFGDNASAKVLLRREF